MVKTLCKKFIKKKKKGTVDQKIGEKLKEAKVHSNPKKKPTTAVPMMKKIKVLRENNKTLYEYNFERQFSPSYT